MKVNLGIIGLLIAFGLIVGTLMGYYIGLEDKNQNKCIPFDNCVFGEKIENECETFKITVFNDTTWDYDDLYYNNSIEVKKMVIIDDCKDWGDSSAPLINSGTHVGLTCINPTNEEIFYEYKKERGCS